MSYRGLSDCNCPIWDEGAIHGPNCTLPHRRRPQAEASRPDQPPRDNRTDEEIVAEACKRVMEERGLTAEEALRWMEMQAVVERRTLVELARAWV
jgi:sulfur relay (sulfurtransferase) complex TusBCD TusD component (DsrE family)